MFLESRIGTLVWGINSTRELERDIVCSAAFGGGREERYIVVGAAPPQARGKDWVDGGRSSVALGVLTGDGAEGIDGTRR